MKSRTTAVCVLLVLVAAVAASAAEPIALQARAGGFSGVTRGGGVPPSQWLRRDTSAFAGATPVPCPPTSPARAPTPWRGELRRALPAQRRPSVDIRCLRTTDPEGSGDLNADSHGQLRGGTTPCPGSAHSPVRVSPPGPQRPHPWTSAFIRGSLPGVPGPHGRRLGAKGPNRPEQSRRGGLPESLPSARDSASSPGQRPSRTPAQLHRPMPLAPQRFRLTAGRGRGVTADGRRCSQMSRAGIA